MSYYTNLFNEFFNEYPNTNPVTTEEGHHTITLVVPGFKKDDFHIDINHDYLEISTQPEETRPHGVPIHKRFSFNPNNINTKKMEASYEAGILTITIPKTKHKHKRLLIK